ncbi:MAG: hypothetical protein RI897_3048 [Verrucomicrobiota bacterium]
MVSIRTRLLINRFLWVGDGLGGESALFHFVEGHDFDAFDFDAFLGFAGFAAGAGADGCGGDFFEDVVTAEDLAEGGVFVIEEGGGTVADEELGSGGVGGCGAGHGEDAADVFAVIELGFDGVAGAAGAVGGFLGGVFGIGVTALDHEALHDAVEGGAVVEALFGEFFEVFDRIGCDVGPELDDHGSLGCFHDGDLLFGVGGIGAEGGEGGESADTDGKC